MTVTCPSPVGGQDHRQVCQLAAQGQHDAVFEVYPWTALRPGPRAASSMHFLVGAASSALGAAWCWTAPACSWLCPTSRLMRTPGGPACASGSKQASGSFMWGGCDNAGPAGLALDCTCTKLAVPHPAPDQDALGPCPVAVLATSDGQFRFFTLGSRRAREASRVRACMSWLGIQGLRPSCQAHAAHRPRPALSLHEGRQGRPGSFMRPGMTWLTLQGAAEGLGSCWPPATATPLLHAGQQARPGSLAP